MSAMESSWCMENPIAAAGNIRSVWPKSLAHLPLDRVGDPQEALPRRSTETFVAAGRHWRPSARRCRIPVQARSAPTPAPTMPCIAAAKGHGSPAARGREIGALRLHGRMWIFSVKGEARFPVGPKARFRVRRWRRRPRRGSGDGQAQGGELVHLAGAGPRHVRRRRRFAPSVPCCGAVAP